MGWNPVRTSQQILSPIVLQREYQWLRRSTMYSLSFLTLVRTTGDNIWSIEYYANDIKPLAVLLNFSAGAIAVFVCYSLYKSAEHATKKYKHRHNAEMFSVGD